MKKEIQIKVIGIDREDNFMKYEAYFNNGLCAVTLEFYGNSDEFESFGQGLIDFPQSHKDKVTYKLGNREDSKTNFLMMEVYCFDLNGHAAIKIESINNSKAPEIHNCRFEIESEVASINRFGETLKNWKTMTQDQIEWEPN